jgi:L-amino acid N-acyltransferase YncA
LSAIIATGVETSMSETLTLADQQAYISNFPKWGVFLVAEVESGGPIIGMQSIEPLGTPDGPNGHLADISTFVDAAHRGTGVGSELMHRLCAEAGVWGFRKLLATIRADNSAAQGFHARSGFRVVGLLEGHTRYRGRFIDQVLAERTLVESRG